MKLVVTRKHHTCGGKTFLAGEEFDGTEQTLAAFSDRLAPADQSIKTSDAPKRGRPKKVTEDADASDSE